MTCVFVHWHGFATNGVCRVPTTCTLGVLTGERSPLSQAFALHPVTPFIRPRLIIGAQLCTMPLAGSSSLSLGLDLHPACHTAVSGSEVSKFPSHFTFQTRPSITSSKGFAGVHSRPSPQRVCCERTPMKHPAEGRTSSTPRNSIFQPCKCIILHGWSVPSNVTKSRIFLFAWIRD